jgi:hypothetical protein
MEAQMLKIGILAFCVLSFAIESANAQTKMEDLVRQAELAVSAFECSVLADDKKETGKLLQIGFGEGRGASCARSAGRTARARVSINAAFSASLSSGRGSAVVATMRFDRNEARSHNTRLLSFTFSASR